MPDDTIEVHDLEKSLVSFQIFDCPQNWQTLVKWLWDYGDQLLTSRLIIQFGPQLTKPYSSNTTFAQPNRTTSTLPPLDPDKLKALVPNGDDAGCRGLHLAREWLERYKDLAYGLKYLLMTWNLFGVVLYLD